MHDGAGLGIGEDAKLLFMMLLILIRWPRWIMVELELLSMLNSEEGR